VPLGAALLLDTERLGNGLGVVLLVLDRADGADLRVIAAQLPLRVKERMDMETGGGRAPGQLAEPQDQLLLEIVGEAILGTEKNNATLRDFTR